MLFGIFNNGLLTRTHIPFTIKRTYNFYTMYLCCAWKWYCEEKIYHSPLYFAMSKVWTTLIFGSWRHGIYLEM